MKLKSYGLVLLAACLWGMIGVIGRIAFLYGMSAFEISFWRAAISGFLFLIHAGLTQQLRLERWQHLGWFVLFGLLGVTLFNASYFLAVENGGVTLATIMLYTAPVFVAIASRFLFGERLSTYKLLLIGLTIGGIGLISFSGGGTIRVSLMALMWGGISGATYALYYIFGKYFLLRYQTITIMALALPIGAIGLVPFFSFAPRLLPAWLFCLWLLFVLTSPINCIMPACAMLKRHELF